MSELPTDPESPATKPGGIAQLVADVKRLYGLAVKLGAILAVVCHILPPHYRVPCQAVAQFCSNLTP